MYLHDRDHDSGQVPRFCLLPPTCTVPAAESLAHVCFNLRGRDWAGERGRESVSGTGRLVMVRSCHYRLYTMPSDPRMRAVRISVFGPLLYQRGYRWRGLRCQNACSATATRFKPGTQAEEEQRVPIVCVCVCMCVCVSR